jgi:hypothetical protein
MSVGFLVLSQQKETTPSDKHTTGSLAHPLGRKERREENKMAGRAV